MNLPHDAANVIVFLSISFGLVQCFFGYRIFKFLLGLWGFLLGGIAAGSIAMAMSHSEGAVILIGIVGGCLGAWLFIALYYVGVFLMGAFLGGVIGAVLSSSSGHTPEPAVLLILAVIGGVVALYFQKLLIILATSFGGAWSVVIGFAYFKTHAFSPFNLERALGAGGNLAFAIVLCWLLLGFVGVWVQYRSPYAKQGEPLARRTPDAAEKSGACPDPSCNGLLLSGSRCDTCGYTFADGLRKCPSCNLLQKATNRECSCGYAFS